MGDSTSKLLGLLNLMEETDKLSPSYDIKKKAPIDDILNKIGATKTYANKLREVMNAKNNPNQARLPMLGPATNTGEYISDYVDYNQDFDAQGKPIAPGMVKSAIRSLVSAINPEYAGQRAAFQSSLKDLEKIGFEFGGKTLTGTEKPAVTSTIPTQFDDEPAFAAKYNQEMKKNIPSFLKNQVRNLIDMGYDEEGAYKLIKDVMQGLDK